MSKKKKKKNLGKQVRGSERDRFGPESPSGVQMVLSRTSELPYEWTHRRPIITVNSCLRLNIYYYVSYVCHHTLSNNVSLYYRKKISLSADIFSPHVNPFWFLGELSL